MIKPKATRVSFYTLGCRLNQSETAVLQNSFEALSYEVVAFDVPADIVVVNTCTVTENGDADTRRVVNRIQRRNPNSRIALIGCQAQIQKEALARLPNVQWIVGNAEKMNLAELLKNLDAQEEPHIITPTIPRDNFTIPYTGIDRQHTRANLKIQDGCDFFCSFCEIPYARGRARSRVFDDIMQEAKVLVEAGHQELVITGINLGTYSYKGKNFMHVLDALEKMEGLARIRISSIEPTTIPNELIERMATQGKLCRYLHIPLQSGNDEVLGRMKRLYTSAEYAEFIQRVSEHVPEICIGTDVIVGFPGETDEHFQHTVDILAESPIHYFHVFSYSQRLLAKSKDLADSVEVRTIQKRSYVLRELSQRKRRVFYKSFLGSTYPVLFEQRKDGYWVGLTDNYLRVKVQSLVPLSNLIRHVKLIEVQGKFILGTI